tara:strand:- start:330 stop:944 length:615 start_codon:yes stop_codon:yes gene_type:complete
MTPSFKSIIVFLSFFFLHTNLVGESNPHKFIDFQSQKMVSVIINNQDLFVENPELFKEKISLIFEPMVDFRRVGASVMGKKYYLASSKSQRLEFIQAFKNSLLDTYTSTLAQWGDQKIVTVFPEVSELKKTEDVQQNLITASNTYPIIYKVRKNKNGDWLIINIIVNGVNLGLTFRNQFQALAKEHNENIDEIIRNWTSDADLN